MIKNTVVTTIGVFDDEQEFNMEPDFDHSVHVEIGPHVEMVFFTPEAMHNFADQLKSAAEAWDSRNATETLNS